MILPVPPQAEQVMTLAMRPMGVLVTDCTWPLPWQTEQVSAWVPGLAPLPEHMSQVSARRMLSSFLTPKAASSKVMVTELSRSAPGTGALGLRREPPNPPPKKAPNRSSIPPMPPKPLKLPLNPPPPICGPSGPNWSYWARRVLSLRVS